MASVRSLAAEFTSKHQKLDALINNAGVFLAARDVTPEGFERMFATNYFGPFLLTRLLIRSLEEAKPSRIVNVTAPSTTRPDLDDLQGERKFSSMSAFGESKAADLLFTYALARRLEGRGVTVNAFHPGIMKTGLNRTAPGAVKLIGGMMNLFAGKPPMVAAEALVKLATSEEFAQTNGLLIHGGKPISAPFIDERELQESLWKVSCGLVGVEETL
jgi:NAD(P)-dependent dehydrogenase (short-subunit alcohol dehydrogenase family)